jgi:bacillithiol system protein YtxJ
MNFFKNIFKNTPQDQISNRIDLIDEVQLDVLIERSSMEPILIFKHSTCCGTSFMVLKRFESEIAKLDKPYYFLDISKYRALSNLIEEKFQIRHESPQLLVLKNKKVVAHGSHSGVLNVEI